MIKKGTDSKICIDLFGTKGQALVSLNTETSLDKEKDIFEKGKTDVFEVETTNIGKV